MTRASQPATTPPVPNTAGPGAPAPTAGSARVLLVEDDEDQALFARRWLERAGAGRVRSVTELAAARAALGSEKIDVVFLDLSLPDSALDETIDAIGSLAQARTGVRVVAMSALDDASVESRVLANGAAGFVAKSAMSQETLGQFLGDGVAAEASAGLVETPVASPDSETGAAMKKLAHDAHTWIANATFRLSALRTIQDQRDADDEEQLEPHLESIELSLDGLTHHVRAARAFADDCLHDRAPREFSLEERMDGLVEACRAHGSYESLSVEASALPESFFADEDQVRCVLDVFMENACVHGKPRERRVLSVCGVPGENAVALTDDGGSWNVPRIGSLGVAGFRGNSRSPRAGFGLFRARRVLESSGGSLTFEEVEPGSGAIRAVARFGSN